MQTYIYAQNIQHGNENRSYNKKKILPILSSIQTIQFPAINSIIHETNLNWHHVSTVTREDEPSEQHQILKRG